MYGYDRISWKRKEINGCILRHWWIGIKKSNNKEDKGIKVKIQLKVHLKRLEFIW
jgi:hypothetical protein